jgi:dTDP-4-dehydrorhamnose reductase
MKLLVTGRNGQVGRELERALAPLGEVVAFDRATLDLADPASIRRAIRDVRPQVIVNAAAYTAVDRAETETGLALTINGIAPGIMAAEARRCGALLVHYSTDYVFDGTKQDAYVEDDPVNPVNAYGRSKLAGEAAIRGTGAPHLILRTSWVYAAHGVNFLRTMLKLAAERAELRIVDDQIGAPTSAHAIADVTARLLSGRPLAQVMEKSGTYHFTASGAVSWFGFAKAIFERVAARNAAFRAPRLIPIPASEYPLPARRPANSRLNTGKLAAAFGITPSPWEAMLEDCIAEPQR